jgi:hypothetical protein
VQTLMHSMQKGVSGPVRMILTCLLLTIMLWDRPVRKKPTARGTTTQAHLQRV